MFLDTELVNLGCDRKIFEVGQVLTSRASLHPSQLILGFRFRRYIFAVHRVALQLFAELQQRLFLGSSLVNSLTVVIRSVGRLLHSGWPIGFNGILASARF